MGQMQRILQTIRTSIGGMGASQKLLIASLAVVMVMTLFLIHQYAGGPATVELLGKGAPGDQQARAAAYLQAASVPFTRDAKTGSVMVPVHMQRTILAQMSQEGQLPTDNRLLFDSLIERQSWMKNTQQNQQMEMVALQNELNLIIGKMNGVRTARVIIDVPQSRSLGQPNRVPTASVTVFADQGMNQKMVDAIAHLVASSRSGLDVSRVRVIDGTNNRQFRAAEEGGLASGTYLEQVIAFEERKRSQLYDMLAAYIPGVVVTVHAQIDHTQRRVEDTRVHPEGRGTENLVSREQVTESRDSQPLGGGEAGVRPNTGADIASLNAGTSMSSTQSQSETEFLAQTGRVVERKDIPGGFPIKINAVVNVPRSYFVEIWRRQTAASGAGAEAPAGGDAARAEPSETDLEPVVQRETARLKRDVELQIDTSGLGGSSAGTAEVSMIYTMPELAPASAGGVGAASILGLPGGTLAMGDLIKTVALGGLAVMALGLVVFTAFKSQRHEKLPSAAELVGLPPALQQAEADLVGEAAEADSALAGIELSEDDLKQRKIVEQVAEMVKDRPQDAAAIVSRWMTES